MALDDYDFLSPSNKDEGPVGTLGDFGKAFGAGAANVGAGGAAALRYFYELGGSEKGADLARSLERLLDASGDAVTKSMNPRTQELVSADLTSKEFWEHPILATALKTTGMLPSVAAIAVPAGLMGSVAAATAAAAGGGALLSAGDGLNEFYKKLDETKDDDLQKQSAKYAALREIYDEKTARAEFNTQMQGMGPAINAILGAVTGLVGPAGTVARKVGGANVARVLGREGEGKLRSGTLGAIEGLTTNAVQEGVADTTVQQAEVNAQFKNEIDYAQTANRAIEGGYLGGIMGGGAGAATARRAPAKPSVTDAPVGTTGTASTPPPPPPVDTSLGNPQSAPTRSARDIAKKPQPGQGNPVSVVEGATAPDAAQMAAVQAAKQAPVAAPTEMAAAEQQGAPPEVVAASQRVAQAQAENAPEAVPAAPSAPPSAPPEVVAASERIAAAQAPVEQPAAPVDTGMNLPESPDTLTAQLEQLAAGDRAAVMIPKGTKVDASMFPPSLGKLTSLAQMSTPRGTFIFNSRLVKRGDIKRASDEGNENLILGLGPVNKAEVISRVEQGEQPVGVVERTPEGVEVRAAAGTAETAPAQMQAIQEVASPGNTVAVENPVETMAARVEPKRTGRVLPNLNNKAKPIDLNKVAAKNLRTPAGKNRDDADVSNIERVRQEAPKVVSRHPHVAGATFEQTVARAKAMLADADANNISIPSTFRDAIKKDNIAGIDEMIVLAEARQFLKTIGKSKSTTSEEALGALVKFIDREHRVLNGDADDVRAERRVETEMRFKRAPSSEEAEQSGAQQSAKMGMRGFSDGTVEGKVTNKKGATEKVAVAKAANAGTVRSGSTLSAEEKARILAASNAAMAKNTVSDADLATERARAARAYDAPPEDAPKKPTRTEIAIETSKRISAAAREIERNPSQAQIEAGNYSMGHVSVHGINVTLKNARGSLRRSTAADGTEQVVRMPDHYGDINGFKGADGGNIGVFVGRDLKSDRVFVIDQNFIETGNFDRHKVMLGYRDEAQALAAYDKAFSDGKGMKRVGNIHEYSITEFKQFLKNGDLSRPALETEAALEPSADQQAVMHHRTGRQRVAMLSEPATDALANLDLSKMDPVGQKMATFLRKQMSPLVSDVTLHYLDANDLAEMVGRPVGDVRGMYASDEGGRRIYIDAREASDPNRLAHVVLHETAHAAVMSEIHANPKVKALIRTMMEDTRAAIEKAQGLNSALFEKYRYAFTNEDEFMSEAFGNSGFQAVLMQMPASKELRATLRLGETTLTNMWDRVVMSVKTILEGLLGRKLPGSKSMLAAAMRTGEFLINERKRNMQFEGLGGIESAFLERSDVTDFFRNTADQLGKDAKEFARRALASPDASNPANAPFALAMRTFNNVAQMADNFFRDFNPVRTIQSLVERQRVHADNLRNEFEPVMKQLDKLRRTEPEAFRDLERLMHDATVANVHPDVPLSDPKNAHTGKSATFKGTQSRARHADLARRFRALAEKSPAAIDAYHAAVRKYSDAHNKSNKLAIDMFLKVRFGSLDNALAQRIFDGKTTEADDALLSENGIDELKQLAKVQGPYVPLVRQGDFVIKGRVDYNKPTNATEVAKDIWEFDDRGEAQSYAGGLDIPAEPRSVWVDSLTGLTTSTDVNGKQHRIIKDDPTAIQKFRVHVDPAFVDMAKTKAEAVRRHQELTAQGNLELDGLQPKRYDPNRASAGDVQGLLGNLAKQIERTAEYRQADPTQKAVMMGVLRESAAIASANKVINRTVQRRGVKGYSENLIENMYDYATSSAQYRARMEYAPAIADARKQMMDAIDDDSSKQNTWARQAIANDVEKRLTHVGQFEQEGTFSRLANRALTISFIDKLASPAYSIINGTQPIMITAPVLASKHGVSRTFVEMGRTYRDISSATILKEGAKGTARRFKGDADAVDLISMAKRNLSADEIRAIDAGIAEGVIDANAGMEMGSLARDRTGVGGKIDTGIGYLEGIAREMPRAVETVNRVATMVAAYRLEKGRNATHEAAVQYALDTVNNTQFNYAPTNSPKIFSHPLAKLALQFKKYGQGMYQLIGMQIGKAMRNANPGDRAEALRALGGIALTHAAMAGALGLPTEPFKYLVMGAHGVGLTGTSWGDIETSAQGAVAAVTGKTTADAIMNGLPRLAGIDLSSRMGLSSLMTFGEPRSNKEADVKSFILDSVAGPVAGLGVDWFKGVSNLVKGDVTKAAEQLVPVKALSDSIRAYRQFTEGKKTPAGRQTSAPYSVGEAGARALGFGTAREAQENASRSAYYSLSRRQSEERTELVNAWVLAQPGDKAKAFAAITRWNAKRPKEAQIKMADLTRKQKTESSLKPKLQNGIATTKRDQYIQDRLKEIY